MTTQTADAPQTAHEDPSVRWYIIHAYSGQENRVKNSLDQRVKTMDMSDRIFHVVVPTEDEMEIKGGQKKAVSRTIFPGYILVQMRMDEESWFIVRNTPGVTGFVSAEDEVEQRPLPVPLEVEEVEKILSIGKTDAPRPRIGLEKGQKVRITDGPFMDFMGVVDDISQERAKVKVLVSFFGRETPVELDFLQVERT